MDMKAYDGLVVYFILNVPVDFQRVFGSDVGSVVRALGRETSETSEVLNKSSGPTASAMLDRRRSSLKPK